MSKSLYSGLILAIVAIVSIYQTLNHQQISHPYKDLTWGDINFLSTTDTHGWYAGHLNQKIYSGSWADFVSLTQHLKEIAAKNGQDLLVIDSGDRHDGNGLSDATTPNGIASVPIFIKQDYDVITVGNHELYRQDISQEEFETVRAHYKDKYVSSNVEFKLDNGTFVPFGNRYRYFETENTHAKVLAFGFVFDFSKYNDGTRVIPIKKLIKQNGWFQQVVEEYSQPNKVDIIVVAAHVPIDHRWKELYDLNAYLRQYFPNTVIQYFGGHSHIRDFSVLDSKATAIQAGRYCETVGWVSVDLKATKKIPTIDSFDGAVEKAKKVFSRTYIDFNADTFAYHAQTSPSKLRTERSHEIAALINSTREQLNLSRAIGHVNNNYYVDYVPLSSHKNIFNLLTSKVLTTLEPKVKNPSAERVIIINTGSIRYDLYKGPYTVDSHYIVSPFENDWSIIVLPKSVAIKIAPTLNNNDYIIKNQEQKENDQFDKRDQKVLKTPSTQHYQEVVNNKELLPPHQYNLKSSVSLHPLDVAHQKKLSKGYLTHDDFGHDGDDTLHRPVVNFPVPSVVESQQLNSSDETLVDLVFYDFITSNILAALSELGYPNETKVEPYSDVYLGTLLDQYIQNYEI